MKTWHMLLIGAAMLAGCTQPPAGQNDDLGNPASDVDIDYPGDPTGYTTPPITTPPEELPDDGLDVDGETDFG